MTGFTFRRKAQQILQSRLRLIGLLVCTFALMAPQAASAQDPLSRKERNKVVEAIVEPWDEWETMTISGKLKMAGLPLSPSVKIYMEKDSLLRISLRAPLMGEVGRAEIDSDSILVVNKMKKTYVKESLADAMSRYPLTLGDVQSVLLGRVALPGAGELTNDIREMVELFPEEGRQYSLVPAEAIELEEFNYGYLIDDSMRAAVLLVMPTQHPDTNVSVTYEYFDKGYDINVSYQSPTKIYGGSLQLDYPTEGGTEIDPIKINSKYTKLSFEQFVKSF